MPLLPDLHTEAALDAFVEDADAVRVALDGLAQHLGIDGPLVPPVRGSALVGLGSTEVLKCMGPPDRVLAQTEVAGLLGLDGRLPVPTPRLIDSGEIDGWTWIRMTRLEGEELTEAWPRLDGADRLSLATQLGEALAALHGLSAPADVPRVDWERWQSEQLAGMEDRQRSLGCPEALVDGLEAWVRSVDTTAGRTGWLHTEVMREHLLVQQMDGGWRLTGLFDFEPSWVGPVDYEFASVGVFFGAREPGVLREVLRAHGSAPSSERLLAMAALHRYANLGWYHRRLGGPLDLGELADTWFAV